MACIMQARPWAAVQVCSGPAHCCNPAHELPGRLACASRTCASCSGVTACTRIVPFSIVYLPGRYEGGNRDAVWNSARASGHLRQEFENGRLQPARRPSSTPDLHHPTSSQIQPAAHRPKPASSIGRQIHLIIGIAACGRPAAATLAAGAGAAIATAAGAGGAAPALAAAGSSPAAGCPSAAAADPAAAAAAGSTAPCSSRTFPLTSAIVRCMDDT